MSIDPVYDSLVDEALNLLGSTVCAVSYGISFTLYCFSASSLYRRSKRSGQRNASLAGLVYMTFAIGCGTAYFGLSHYFTQMAYIFDRDFPGGPIMYITNVLSVQRPYIACLVIMALMDWLALGVQIWRLSILWKATSYIPVVIVLPIILFLGCIGSGFTVIVIQTKIKSLPGDFAYFATIAFFGTPPVTTVLMTALMVSRLLIVRRHHIDIMGNSKVAKHYLGIVAILVESYALDATWSTVMIVTYAIQEHLIYSIFTQASVNIKVIAMFLIVYRVANGRGWKTHTTRELNSLRWDRGAQTVVNELRPGPLHDSTTNPDIVTHPQHAPVPDT